MKPRLQFTPVERATVLEIVRRVLADRPDVVFGYVFGSFPQDRPFHDLDVAVYWDTMAQADASAFALDLAEELERTIRATCAGAEWGRLPVDVRTLNGAPLSFCYHAFRGRLVLCRDEALHTRLAAGTVQRYLDLKPLRHQALKEAMLAC